MRTIAAILFAGALLSADDRPCVELYDVADLISAAQDFPGTGERAGEGIDVVAAIEAAVPDVTWGHGAEIRSNAGLVEVHATCEVQERVRAVVESLRRNRKTLIQIDARLIEVDLERRAGLLQRAGVSVSKEGVDGSHCRASLTPLQAQILLARIGHETKGSWLLSSPRLTVVHAQRASITISSQTAYIQDYHVRSACVEDPDMTDGAVAGVGHARVITASEPIVARFDDGVVLDVRVLRAADGRLRLAGLARTSSLLAMEELPIDLANGVRGTIQMPHAAVEELTFNVELTDGETLLLLGGVRRDGRAAMWLVTPTVVEKE